MIKVVKSALLLFFGIFASCATTNREEVSMPSELPAEAGASHAPLENRVYAARLDPEVLSAFEVKALSKLEDCYEYFHIVSNPSYDTTFRKQAMEQVLGLFPGDSAPPYTGLDPALPRLTLFLNELYQGNWGEVAYQLDQVALKIPLKATSDTTYSGQITYMLQLSDQPGPTGPVLQDIVVKKVATDFGSEVNEVWKVFLGN